MKGEQCDGITKKRGRRKRETNGRDMRSRGRGENLMAKRGKRRQKKGNTNKGRKMREVEKKISRRRVEGGEKINGGKGEREWRGRKGREKRG